MEKDSDSDGGMSLQIEMCDINWEGYEWKECEEVDWEQHILSPYQNMFHEIREWKNEIDPYYSQIILNKDGEEMNRWEAIRRKWNKTEIVFQSNQMDKEQSICKIQPISRAFFKCWEIMDHFELGRELHSLKTLHLAEAPGGFIESFVCYRQQNLDEYYGISLSNTNPSIPSWGKLLEKRRKNTFYQAVKRLEYANLMDRTALEQWNEKFMKWNTCDYVTADGGFDFRYDFNGQEKMMYPLLYFESMWALLYVKPGGTFICKCFDFYTPFTQHWFLFTKQYFERWDIFKPMFSRDANSEKYIVFFGKKDMKLDEQERMVDWFYSVAKKKWISTPSTISWIEKQVLTKEDKVDLERLHTHLLSFYEKQKISIQFLIDKLQTEDGSFETNSNFIYKKYVHQCIGDAIQWCKKHRLPINHQSRYLKYYFIEHEYNH